MPSGVAAGLSTPGRQIVVFVGDGGAMMTGNELATAIQYGVPIKIFVSNNKAYGTIRMHQAKAFPGRVTSTELVNPDFAAWGEAFGARGFKIETEAEVDEVVAEAMAHDGPCVIETRVSLNHKRGPVFPMRREIYSSARDDEMAAAFTTGCVVGGRALVVTVRDADTPGARPAPPACVAEVVASSGLPGVIIGVRVHAAAHILSSGSLGPTVAPPVFYYNEHGRQVPADVGYVCYCACTFFLPYCRAC